MGRIVEMVFKAGRGLPTYLSKEHQEQLQQKLVIINIKRERILAYILSAFLLIIMGFILLYRDTVLIDKYLSRDSINIHFTLITLSALFLIHTRNVETITADKMLRYNILHYTIVLIVMVFCALIAINNEVMNQRPFAYIIAMYSISSCIILNKFERYTIYLISYTAYLSGLLLNWGISFRIWESIVFSFPLLSLALIANSINYSAFIRNFISSRLIQEKNRQLDKMYKTVEELLEKRTEQLNHAMEIDKLRTSFFSNISHELRTPLNLIFSAEQMLQLVCGAEDLNMKRKDILKYNNIVQQNCFRLIRLIENLIDITEIDAGQHSMHLGTHDVVRLVRELATETAAYVKERDINLVFHSELDEKYIVCDAEKIERIVLNLLSNAVKFTPQHGFIKIFINESDGHLIIKVMDTGIGIPSQMKNSVFERFIQVDKSHTRLREGSGIGLSIVKAFVDLHQGEIAVTSEEGEGSTFTIRIPTELYIDTEIAENQTDYKCYEKVRMEFSDLYY